MAVLDWIFAAVMLLSVLLGAWRGLVFEVLSLLSWIVALVVAKSFALDVAQLLPMKGSSETLRFAAGFVLVFIAVVLLGGLFGSLRGALLLLLVTVVVGMTPAKNSVAWRESVAVAWSVSVLKAVK